MSSTKMNSIPVWREKAAEPPGAPEKGRKEQKERKKDGKENSAIQLGEQRESKEIRNF